MTGGMCPECGVGDMSEEKCPNARRRPRCVNCCPCHKDDSTPTLGPIRRRNGVAGQVAYDVTVTYPGEDAARVSFVGSTFGGPVLMVTASGVETFVTDPARFGAFGPGWVRRFFS